MWFLTVGLVRTWIAEIEIRTPAFPFKPQGQICCHKDSSLKSLLNFG